MMIPNNKKEKPRRLMGYGVEMALNRNRARPLMYTIKIKKGTGVQCCDGCKVHHLMRMMPACVCKCHTGGRAVGRYLRIWLSKDPTSPFGWKIAEEKRVKRPKFVRDENMKIVGWTDLPGFTCKNQSIVWVDKEHHDAPPPDGCIGCFSERKKINWIKASDIYRRAWEKKYATSEKQRILTGRRK